MRTTLMSMLLATGIALVGVTGSSAAPASGTAPAGASILHQIQYGGYGGYGGGYYRRYCWRERVCDYYGYCRYVRRCNY
jgi:hypothetical protein